MISPAFFFFKILIFWFFLSHSIFQKLLIISSRFFFVHRCKIASVFLYFFFKKINIVNIKILAFFIGPLHQLFNKQLFFKFIKKCQTEILRCALPSSYVCDFLYLAMFKLNLKIYSFCSILGLAQSYTFQRCIICHVQ